MKTCAACGHSSDERFTQCTMCGMPLPAAQAAPAPLPRAAPGSALANQPARQAEPDENIAFRQRLLAASPRTWVVPLLLALNFVAFIVVTMESQALFSPTGAILLRCGADFGPLTATANQWWRAVACCFLHFGVLHLLFNMFALFQAGLLTERLFGSWFFLLLYLACGLIASLASLWGNPMSVAAGASGAVFGVYGALLGYLGRQRAELPEGVLVPLAKGALLFIVWNVLSSLHNSMRHSMDETMRALHDATNGAAQAARSSAPLIDQAAHVGGFLSGLLFGFIAARPLALPRRQAMAASRGWLLAAGACALAGLLLVPVLQAYRGDAEPLRVLGAMYFSGEGVAKSPERAVRWFKRAAESGDIKSQAFLGAVYRDGQGVTRDMSEAINWFAKAAEQGDLDSQKALASMYLRGDGVEANVTEAARWLSMLGDEGDLNAQKLLASIYYKGRDVPRDLGESIRWMTKAAEQGDLQAQNALGRMYLLGEEVKPDEAEAAKWFRKAANQGDPASQTALGLILAGGRGLAHDPIEALTWFVLSRSTESNALIVRRALESQMTAAQIEEVRLRVQKFRETEAANRGSRVKRAGNG